MVKRMDPKLSALCQDHEVAYIARKFRIPIATVRKVIQRIGRSRKKVYEALRALNAKAKRVQRKKAA